MTDRSPVRSYSSDFPNDENPISEGGMWLNGKADGIDWADVVITNGVVHGGPSRMNVAEQRAEQGNLDDSDEAPAGDYDDPTAVLTGDWGPDQHGKGCRPQRQPHRRVLPGGADPPPQHDGAEKLQRLRGLLPLPQDR